MVAIQHAQRRENQAHNVHGARYTVQRGDTLSEIAQNHDVTLGKLLLANPHIKNPNLIHPGQQLTVPQKTKPAAHQKPAPQATHPQTRQPRQTQDPNTRHAPPPSTVTRGALEARIPARDSPVAHAAPSAAQVASGPKPKGMAERAAWYQAVVKQSGGTWRTGTNQVNIVGLRGQDVNGQRNGNSFNQWNDTMAYVWKDTHGKMQVREFRATTDPGMKWGDGRDANGDGVKDIAHLRPGSYAYHLGTHRGQWGAGNPNSNLPVDRDTNHDGRISVAERAASKRRGDVGYGINIHWGDSATVGGWSLGCQVIKGSYGAFRANVTPIMQLNQGQMYYTLVDRSR